jgi:hypothetical protein
VGVRGELSLEHSFRLLTLILDADLVRAAFHGVILNDRKLKSFALEYLEHVLPTDIRDKLWPFIGDISDHQREKSKRPLEQVASDLLTTGTTLFQGKTAKIQLEKIIDKKKFN